MSGIPGHCSNYLATNFTVHGSKYTLEPENADQIAQLPQRFWDFAKEKLLLVAVHPRTTLAIKRIRRSPACAICVLCSPIFLLGSK